MFGPPPYEDDGGVAHHRHQRDAPVEEGEQQRDPNLNRYTLVRSATSRLEHEEL